MSFCFFLGDRGGGDELDEPFSVLDWWYGGNLTLVVGQALPKVLGLLDCAILGSRQLQNHSLGRKIYMC